MGLAESAMAPSPIKRSLSSRTPPHSPTVSAAATSREETARVAVLADGTCAFFKGRRRSNSASSPPSTIESQLGRLSEETDCHYTCHPQCRDLVTLDCQAVEAGSSDQRESDENGGSEDVTDSETTEESTEGDTSHHSQDNSEVQTLEQIGKTMQHSGDELRHLVAEYTAAAPPGLGITLDENGTTFHGFIRVHLNLSRPISVVAGSRPPSIYDILKEDETIEKTLTSFYLPRDTVKALHITCETTTHEVVVALLKKFKVVDNPRKFALYERYFEDGDINRAKMRRVAESEKPLALALKWHQQTDCSKMFVLQENETEDILWEAFTLPELGNFLRILDREEEEYKKRVEQKYELIAMKLQEAMDSFKLASESHVLESDRCDTDGCLIAAINEQRES